MEEERNLIELVDEDGNALKLEHLLTFENNDAFYAAFLPYEEDEKEESDEVVIMRLEEDEKGDDMFLPIEDDEELESAWEAFLNIYYEDDEDDDEDEDKDPDELGENK